MANLEQKGHETQLGALQWLVENYSFEDGEVADFAEHKDIDFTEYCHSVGTDYKSTLADILNNFSVI